AHEAPPAPPGLAVLDRLEQEAGAVAHEAEVGGDGGGQVGEQLPPHRDDGVRAGERPELVERRPDHGPAQSPSGPKARKKHVRLPVWQAPPPCWSTRNSRVSPSQS